MSFLRKFSFKSFFLGLLLFLLIVPLSLLGVICYYLGSIETTELNKENLNISQNKQLDDIINIALFGTDNRNPNSKSRSDSIMIASINTKSKKIKLTSIMRDSLVNIPGRGLDKITHAYAYGGPELAVSTLNSNFDLNISDYASVDFFSLAEIVDLLGGFEVSLKSNEAWAMNKAINEINRIEGYSYGTDYVQSSSEPQLLNGRQAVSYARIRKVGNGDYERTDRQRRLLSYCIEKVQELNLSEALNFLQNSMSLVNTSLLPSEIINLATQILSIGNLEIEQLRIPAEGTYISKKYNSMSVLDPDLELNTTILHNFIKDVPTSESEL